MKRFLSVLLLLTILLGLIPAQVFAAATPVTADAHIHEYASSVTAPTCTEQGYTTHTCQCGDSYVDEYVDAEWHSYKDGICAMCGCDMLRVTLEDIVRYQGGVNSENGTLNTTFTNNWYTDIRIPQGAEQVRVLTFRTGANWGSAFLEGTTYLSGFCDPTVGGQWIVADIPTDATVFRYGYLYDEIARKNGFPIFEYVEFVGKELEIQESSQYMGRPATGCHSFRVDVNIAPAQGHPQEYERGTDYGYIQLPTSYTSYGEPTRLIIVCHGAGATLSNYQSDSWKTTNYSFWTDLGYAVMDMYACPAELANGSELHYGNPVVLDCYKAGYDYVMEHFNLKQDGIFLIGSSMGGLSSFQIAQSEHFPVIAQVGYCPVIDLFKQAYCNPWAAASYQRSHIASYFGFTGTQPTFTDNKYPSAAEIEFFRQNFDKTLEYSPILRNVTDGDITSIFGVIPSSATAANGEEAAIYAQLTATHPNPLLIFHNTDDSTVSYRYSQYFVDMVNRGGQEVKLYTFPSGGHNAWANGESVTVSGINGQITIKKSQYEAYKFFEKFEKHEEHQPWIDPAVKATCSTTGLTEGSHCASCDEIIVAQTVTNTTDHTYENGTCTACGTEHPNLINYEGKVISILGDSISTFAGYIPVADGFNLAHRARYPQSNLLTDVNETWWMQILTTLDAKLGINDSWAGSTVSNTLSGNSGDYGENAAMASLTRIRNLGANGTPDVILFYGGTNDIAKYSQPGSFNPTTAPTQADLTATKWDSPADAYVAAILRMRHYYPNAEIVAMLPTYTSAHYTDARLEQFNAVYAAICAHYGVTCIDLRDCGITTADLPDGIHPDASGMDYITGAVLDMLLNDVEMEAGENVVYSVTHNLNDAESSLGYYKGVTHGNSFVTTITGENVTVSVTMGGVDITDTAYANGVITVPAVTGDLVITIRGQFSAGGHLQQLPENLCSGINLWTVLEHDDMYYTSAGWGYHTRDQVRSVTFPVQSGDKIYATSFGEGSDNGSIQGNGSRTNGIRVTFFLADGKVKSMAPNEVYSEFAANGYLTAPEGAIAVCVPMWTPDGSNKLHILNAEHVYESGRCGCGATSGPVITVQPADVQVARFERFSVSVEAKGEGLTYQWYYKDPSMAEFFPSANKTPTYSYGMAAHMAGRQLYCVITDANGEQVTSDIATVSLPDNALKILTQPASVTVAQNEKFTVSVEVKGDGLSYQWYYKDPSMKIFRPTANKTATYSYVMAAHMAGRQVYCVITDAYGNQARTPVATIRLK